jgi:hypothetical protein
MPASKKPVSMSKRDYKQMIAFAIMEDGTRGGTSRERVWKIVSKAFEDVTKKGFLLRLRTLVHEGVFINGSTRGRFKLSDSYKKKLLNGKETSVGG